MSKYIAEISSMKLDYHVWDAGHKFQLYVMNEDGNESRRLGHISTGAGAFHSVLKCLYDFQQQQEQIKLLKATEKKEFEGWNLTIDDDPSSSSSSEKEMEA